MTSLFLYLDPGTGSLLLYAILGVCTTLLFLLKKLYYKIKALIFGRGTVDSANKHYEYVIHSEGGRYFNSFSSIIDEFIKNKTKIVYVTPDEKDPAFEIKSEYIEVICPGNEFKTISFLNNISADIILSTTPHLDIYMWKKSKNVKKYVHIFHAPTSVDLYEKYALSFYDIIINSVEKTEETQKYLDEIRKLPCKQYYTAGCTYYDVMVKQRDDVKRTNQNKTVLYAPSWGLRSSLNTFGIEMIEKLLNSGFDVIFRPHPQSFISDKEKIELVQSKFGNNKQFTIDRNKTGMESMVNSDIMISDFSGVIFDYYYLFNKPVLLASLKVNTDGYEVEDLPEGKQFDIPVTKKITTELTENEIKNISDVVSKKISEKNESNDSVKIQNLGCAGKKIYEILVKIESELK